MTDRVALSMIAATISNYAPELRADLEYAIARTLDADERYWAGTRWPEHVEARSARLALLSDVLTEEPRYQAFRNAS